MNICEMACEIVRRTNDGDQLAPEHLRLVENAVNGFLNGLGKEKFRELYEEVLSGRYRKPFFHGIEHLTLDHEGFVYWKDRQVEHYDFPFAFSERGREASQELARRCRRLEEKGVPVNVGSAIWNWEKYRD